SGTNTQVRFYFQAGSPNDPHPGNGADLGCHTGQTGSCSVTYTATDLGIDLICAVADSTGSSCSEAVDSPDGDDLADMVKVTVANGGQHPTPDPDDDPVPTSTPAPTP